LCHLSQIPTPGISPRLHSLISNDIKLPFLHQLSRSLGGTTTKTRVRRFGMAWRSSGSTNEGLITNLHRNGLIEADRVKDAMLKVHWISCGPLDIINLYQ
jgi:hypothetical protein